MGSPNTPLPADAVRSADGDDPEIFHACANGRLTSSKKAEVGSPLPHPRPDRARPCHICTRTGLAQIKPAVKPKMTLPPAVTRSADSLVGR